MNDGGCYFCDLKILRCSEVVWCSGQGTPVAWYHRCRVWLVSLAVSGCCVRLQDRVGHPFTFMACVVVMFEMVNCHCNILALLCSGGFSLRLVLCKSMYRSSSVCMHSTRQPWSNFDRCMLVPNLSWDRQAPFHCITMIREKYQIGVYRDITASMAYCRPQTHLREVPIVPKQSAVLFIDTQNFNCHKEGACFQNCSTDELQVSCNKEQ